MHSRSWRVVALVVVCSAVAASAAFAQQSDEEWLAQCRSQRDNQVRYCEVRPLSWPAGGPLRVDARPNGGVRVSGWDQGTVAGSARIQAQASTEAEARTAAGRIVIDTAGGTLRADGPKGEAGVSWSVNFVLSAPHRTDVEIEATNGPIALAGLTGQIRVTTVNGPLSLDDLGGDVQARTVNGPVQVALAGDRWNGAGLVADTQNGPIKISMPAAYSAELDLGTQNGPLHLGIPVTVQGDLPVHQRRAVKTTLGAGGAPIRAHTTNGPLSIDKRQD